MKSEYKDILNALVEMQQSHIYASRKQTLFYAEQAIFALEQKLLLSEPTKPECEWSQDDKTESGVWQTKSENMFEVTEGTPKENKMEYCPYCGGRLVEK